MNHDRSFSSPELVPQGNYVDNSNDSTLEGITANVKLLLKIIQHHNIAAKDEDGRGMQRVAGMLTILDDVKHRIQKSQSSGKKRMIEFRRCNTDLRPTRVPKDKKPPEPLDEKQKLLKQLNDSLVARKSLEKMFASLSKEQSMISTELARKVQEISSMDEQLNDLKEQNSMLMEKLQICASKHKEMKKDSSDSQGDNTSLQERNKELSEQLLKSLDGYRSAKRKMKEAQEDNAGVRTMMGEVGGQLMEGLDLVRALQQRFGEKDDAETKEELSLLENILQDLILKVSIENAKEK